MTNVKRCAFSTNPGEICPSCGELIPHVHINEKGPLNATCVGQSKVPGPPSLGITITSNLGSTFDERRRFLNDRGMPPPLLQTPAERLA